MAKLLKLRRGTTSQHSSFTGAEGEVTVDTDKEVLVVHDGSTAGGHPMAAQDMDNVPAGSILGTQLENSGVTAGQYGSSSAIPIVTVDAQGLVTAASTTAIDSTTIANGTSNVAVANNGDITVTRSGTARLVVDGDGVDVTGNITATGNATISGTNLNMSTAYIDFSGSLGSAPTTAAAIYRPADNSLAISTGNAQRLVIANGGASVTGNLDVSGNTAVTGNITCSGTVKGRDVSADGTLLDGLTSSSGVLTDGVTATTQAQSDSSSKVSTTSYVRTAIQNAQAFPSGTKMLFQQTAAPTGWTKVTSGVDNKSIRVVSGTVGSGGSNAFSNTFTNKSITANAANATQGGNITVSDTSAGGNVSIDSATTGGTVDSHTLTTNQMPSHVHYMYTNQYHQQSNRYANSAGFYPGYNGQQTRENAGNSRRQTYNSGYGESVGGDGGHSHGFTGGSHNHNGTLSGTAHSHNASFTGSAHNHSITVSNLDLAVQYLDVIIASKD